MKVIGAGLPRTGTLSQKAALEQLGVGPCQHMANLLANLDAVPSWRRALDGDGEADWDQLFAGFQVVKTRNGLCQHSPLQAISHIRQHHVFAVSISD